MDVGTFTRSIRIGRPIDEVWSVLADIGSITDWNPGVVASRTTTGQFQGEGAGRFCDLGRRMHLDEVMVRRTYARGMEGLLAGLQRHMEDPDA
jgi:hypothetical protein